MKKLFFIHYKKLLKIFCNYLYFLFWTDQEPKCKLSAGVVNLLSITSAVTLMSVSMGYAQEIQIHFPHFAGHSYDWKIFQGEASLTINSGVIDPQGRATLVMPEAHKNYRGMTRWMLKSGGGLDMIYVGNGFSVECLSDVPGDDNIHYTGNPENLFLLTRHNSQQTLVRKLEAVNHLLQVYKSGDSLYHTVSKEQKDLKKRFASSQADRVKSPLYAARFGEIVDFTRGIADKIYESGDDHIRYFNDFITNTLKFENLYTSGHWDQVLHHWLMMNIRSKDNKDPGFQERLDTVLKRMEPEHILPAFAQKTIPLLVKMGQDDLLPGIALILDKYPEAKTALPENVRHLLVSYKILTGSKAPDLVFKAPVTTQTGQVNADIIIKTDNLEADYTLLVFYQSGCQPCEDALIVLSNKYKSLKNKNVRVIAISADDNEQSFEKKRKYHQWPDNYCDFSGLSGVNFKNYAVLGTPTLYLLDRKGIVRDKTALAEDLLDALGELNSGKKREQ